jgi:hypothetical protein
VREERPRARSAGRAQRRRRTPQGDQVDVLIAPRDQRRPNGRKRRAIDVLIAALGSPRSLTSPPATAPEAEGGVGTPGAFVRRPADWSGRAGEGAATEGSVGGASTTSTRRGPRRSGRRFDRSARRTSTDRPKTACGRRFDRSRAVGRSEATPRSRPLPPSPAHQRRHRARRQERGAPGAFRRRPADWSGWARDGGGSEGSVGGASTTSTPYAARRSGRRCDRRAPRPDRSAAALGSPLPHQPTSDGTGAQGGARSSGRVRSATRGLVGMGW